MASADQKMPQTASSSPPQNASLRPAGLLRAAADAGDHQHDAQRGDCEPLVLLDEDQRQRPQHGGPGPAAQQRGQRAGQQRDGEGDLVEVEVDHLGQAPGQAVGGTDHPPGRGAQPGLGRAAHRDHRHRGQQGLRHQQGGRAGEDQEDRGDQPDDGLEVITEQVEARAVDVHHRGMQVRELLDVLGEDAQIPGPGGEAQVAGYRDDRVSGEDGQRDQPRHPVRPAGRGRPRGVGRGRLLRRRIPSAGAGQWLRLTAAGRDHALASWLPSGCAALRLASSLTCPPGGRMKASYRAQQMLR